MDKKEEFLRGRMYEIHLFTMKLLVTFSSSSLAFSIGMLSLFENTNLDYGCALVLGWCFLVISIVLVIVGLFLGLNLTYKYFNNIVDQKPEISTETAQTETRIHTIVILSALTSILGVISILVFAYYNFV